MIKGRKLEAFEKAGRKIWPAVTIRLSSKRFKIFDIKKSPFLKMKI